VATHSVRRPLGRGRAAAAPRHAERENLERAAGVPGLVTHRLGASPAGAVERLLAALGIGEEARR
jgi:hypothetical protein